MQKSSITDLPKKANQKDVFGIGPFEQGLIQFIQNSNTPITIALQGEWGSGKTSLMNSLKNNLCEGEQAAFFDIWLNTWEYSLMKDAQSTLMGIISDLIKKVSRLAEVDEKQTSKMLKKIWGGVKTAGKVVAKNAADKVVDGAGNLIDYFDANESHAGIGEVRDELENIIAQLIQKKNKKGVIFFIDDLDRIDPPVAVELLELLKNIFTIENAVFVLAIDYDVVVKGLEPKFGKLTAQNEREFRSFFDKIIQVPFSMPVSNYSIKEFVKDSLIQINYISQEQAQKEDLINDFSEFASFTLGTNPRALKRLMNSLSLINYINNAKSEQEDGLKDDLDLLLNFALVSIQIAYPAVYRLLLKHPGFDKWNNKTALSLNLKELDVHSIEKLNTMVEFDEEWEQVLYRLCETDFYLKKRAIYISRLLNKMKDMIEAKEENVEDVISAIISLSSVTGIDNEAEVTEVEYHRGWFLKSFRWQLIEKLKEKLPEQKENIYQVGKRVVTNLKINVIKDHFVFSSFPHQGNILLLIDLFQWGFTPIISKNFDADAEKAGINQDLQNIYQKIETILANLPENFSKKPEIHVPKWDGNYVLQVRNVLRLKKPEEVTEYVDNMAYYIVEMLKIWPEMEVLAKKYHEFYQ